ncbi:MAG TPA: helix-turn-helix transcriptional regulator [Bacteroidia bacterium]|nr:helix-turn-helix transcriptional regulator [Bacteroidia bacterium]
MDKKQFLISLGKQVVKLRQKKGWTQSELARNCDKDRQSIERLEKGKINPSAYYLCQIAEGLDISIKELLDISS